jgi:hypothetical protein
MRQARNVLLIGVFWMFLLLAGMANQQAIAWADAETMQPGGTVPIPEMVANAIALPSYDELSVVWGISLTYRTKGIDPLDNNLVVQSKDSAGGSVQIGPEKWVQISKKTFTLDQSFFPDAVEVTGVSATQPISWLGAEGVWAVNATNTGVTLIGTKQVITTDLTMSKVFTNPVSAATTFTFTMRSTAKVAAQWGDVYPTRFTIYNGCPGASWLQRLSSKDRFAFTLPSTAGLTYGQATWDIRHAADTGVVLATGTIRVPICRALPFPLANDFVYLPNIQR